VRIAAVRFAALKSPFFGGRHAGDVVSELFAQTEVKIVLTISIPYTPICSIGVIALAIFSSTGEAADLMRWAR
jgi:hypothetical protein